MTDAKGREVDDVLFWFGTRIEDLPREELLEAFRWLHAGSSRRERELRELLGKCRGLDAMSDIKRGVEADMAKKG